MSQIIIDGIVYDAEYEIKLTVNQEQKNIMAMLSRLIAIKAHDVPIALVGRIMTTGLSYDGSLDIKIHPK